MKNEQRIWNKSELEAHPDWREATSGTWFNDKSDHCITKDMLGQTVQCCKDQGFSVTPEMIAKTEQPKTAIAANGTELVVGERYRFKGLEDSYFIRITAIGETLILGVQENGKEDTFLKYKDWLPYEPKEEQKTLEGYQKWYVLNNNIIQTAYAEKKEEILKSLIGVIVYSEQEAIDLGLKL